MRTYVLCTTPLLYQGSGPLLAKGQSLVIDDIQGYESDAVRLRVMAPEGHDLAPTDKGGASTFELPFPPPSGIGSNQAQCAAASACLHICIHTL